MSSKNIRELVKTLSKISESSDDEFSDLDNEVRRMAVSLANFVDENYGDYEEVLTLFTEAYREATGGAQASRPKMSEGTDEPNSETPPQDDDIESKLSSGEQQVIKSFGTSDWFNGEIPNKSNRRYFYSLKRKGYIEPGRNSEGKLLKGYKLTKKGLHYNKVSKSRED